MGGIGIPGGSPTDPGYFESDFYKNYHNARTRSKQAEGEEDVAREQPGRDARLAQLLKALEGLRGMFPTAFGGASSSSSGTSGGGSSNMPLPPRV